MKHFFTTIKLLVAGLTISIAQTSYAQTLKSFVDSAVDFMSRALIPLIISIGLVMFIWGIIDMVRKADNAEERKKGRNRMLWGIFALFVMFSFLAITSVFTETLFNTGPILPQLYEN